MIVYLLKSASCLKISFVAKTAENSLADLEWVFIVLCVLEKRRVCFSLASCFRTNLG